MSGPTFKKLPVAKRKCVQLALTAPPAWLRPIIARCLAPRAEQREPVELERRRDLRERLEELDGPLGPAAPPPNVPPGRSSFHVEPLPKGENGRNCTKRNYTTAFLK